MLLLFLLFVTFANAYHQTDELILKIITECDNTPELSYYMHEDIPIIEWRKDLSPDILWAFNEHAREIITGELALEMIMELKYIKPDRRVTIVPVVNVWGRKHVEKGNPCQRKNENGVDTNRKYTQKISHSYRKNSQEYQGETPLSEKETKLISSLIQQSKRYINVHSGEYSLYMPWDSITDRPPNHKFMLETLKNYSQFCPECAVGSAAEKSFYKAYGTSVDYATGLGVEAYTFEIFGSNSFGCERMFNPKGFEYRIVLDKWKKIMALTLR